MAKDAVGYALTALNRLASSEVLDKIGMRKTVERLAYTLTKSGFQVLTTTARTFKSSNPGNKPERLNAPGHTRDLFDLSVTDEQQMIRDSVQSFARDVLRDQAEEADATQKTSDEVIAQALDCLLYTSPSPRDRG